MDGSENQLPENVPVGSVLRKPLSNKRERPEKELSKNDIAETPDWILRYVIEQYGCNNDPCPTGYEEGGVPNALEGDWQGVSFVNPPQSECQMWVQKAVEQQAKGNYSVMLVPFNAKSTYWREIVYINASQIVVFKCPVKFNGHKKPQATEMCLLVFAAHEDRRGDEATIVAVEPEGWDESYYKRARNRERFQVAR